MVTLQSELAKAHIRSREVNVIRIEIASVIFRSLLSDVVAAIGFETIHKYDLHVGSYGSLWLHGVRLVSDAADFVGDQYPGRTVPFMERLGFNQSVLVISNSTFVQVYESVRSALDECEFNSLTYGEATEIEIGLLSFNADDVTEGDIAYLETGLAPFEEIGKIDKAIRDNDSQDDF